MTQNTSHEINISEDAILPSQREMFGRHLLESCKKLQTKYHDIATGKIPRYTLKLKDPRAPGSFLRVSMWREDNKVYNDISGYEPEIWEYCKQRRKHEQDLKERGLFKTDEMAHEWFRGTWLLECYLVIKFGIDIANAQNDWFDPKSETGRKLSWILDNDPFAFKYKVTNLMESRGMSDPFNKIQVGV